LDELEELRFAREAAVEYEAWKANPATAEPWDQVKDDIAGDM
jgi:hypothetical protein